MIVQTCFGAVYVLPKDYRQHTVNSPSRPPNEAERLNALRAYGILDTAPEEAFDDLTRLAAQICGTPIAVVCLVDQDRLWFKSKVGLEVSETSRDMAFCAQAVLQRDVFVVEDAAQDEAFARNPLVTGGPQIRFYAGMPLIAPEGGHAIGTLCVMDQQGRQLGQCERSELTEKH